ncbi:DUF4493 domain-containing protein [Muribaculaceae bacterium Isolate-002 (NCI)]|mgnify:CR=1 FL=1|nr:DUF4493 domain-containing protein [Muribaculaceae bacterium Isolate-002 (NCI)]
MRKLYIAGAVATGLMLTASCSDNHDYDLQGEGKLMLSASFSNDVKVASRATLEEELSESTIIWISSTKGLVRKYEGLQNLPADGIKLLGGNYVAEAWAGDSVSASFDAKYYKGRAPFTITSGTTRVELPCRIANVVASVDYSENLDGVLSDYTLTVGHSRGSLEFVGQEQRKGYFMMPSGSKNLNWTLSGKLADGSVFTKDGTIENVQPATEYVMHVTYTPSSSDNGGAFINIVIDETTIDSEDEILITVAPDIMGTSFDIKQGITGQPGMFDKKSVYITASSALKNVILDSQLLTASVGGNDIDLMTAEESVSDALRASGIEWFYVYNEAEDISNMKINLNEEWLNAIAAGEYVMDITAVDAVGKKSTVSMPLIVTNAKAEAVETAADAATTWATSATVCGRVLDSSVTDARIEYRKEGDTQWIAANTVTDGADLSAEISGLTPGTTYEYRVVCEGFESQSKRVTTENALQLPNAGFEDWQVKSGRNATLIYAEGSEMFWDSGNHGSATLQKQVTTPDGTYSHSGNYSALLSSQKVALFGIGRFAAGNIFVGQYLKTDGTDGILGWGRTFGSRPKALKGYVRYEPATISYNDCDKKALPEKYQEMESHVGQMDQGAIYIVILDNDNKMTASSVDSGKETSWPIVVETKKGQIFDVNRPNVIGYGQLILDATGGDGMIEFEVPIEYFRKDVKAANIAVTCSASRYGDYFCGGDSKMWIDDFELVY